MECDTVNTKEKVVASLNKSGDKFSVIENVPSMRNSNEIKKKMPVIDDFTFEKPISRGAFGKVFLGHKKGNENNKLAIKVVKKSDIVHKNMVEQVITERDALARTKSPFCVQLFYSLQTSSNVYLVMEYLIGGDLKSLLFVYGYFDEPMAIFYTAELALALDYLHCHGIVHRDVKPDNLLLDDRGHLKLTDFGLSEITLHKELNTADIASLTPRTNYGLYVHTPGQLLSLTSHLSFSSEDCSTTIGSEASVINARNISDATQKSNGTVCSKSRPCQDQSTPQNSSKMIRKRSALMDNISKNRVGENALSHRNKDQLDAAGSPLLSHPKNIMSHLQSSPHSLSCSTQEENFLLNSPYPSSSKDLTSSKLKSPLGSPDRRDGDVSSEFELSVSSDIDRESGIHPFPSLGDCSVGEIRDVSFEEKHHEHDILQDEFVDSCFMKLNTFRPSPSKNSSEDKLCPNVFQFPEGNNISSSFMQSSSPKVGCSGNPKLVSTHRSNNCSLLMDGDSEFDETRNMASLNSSLIESNSLDCYPLHIGYGAAAELNGVEKLHPRLRALSQLTDHMSPVGIPAVNTISSLILGERIATDIATSSPIPAKLESSSTMIKDKLQPPDLNLKAYNEILHVTAGNRLMKSKSEPQNFIKSSTKDDLPKPDFCQNFKIPSSSPRGIKRPHTGFQCSEESVEMSLKSGMTAEISEFCINENDKKRRNLSRIPFQEISNITDKVSSYTCFTPKRKFRDDISRYEDCDSILRDNSNERDNSTVSEVFSPNADVLTCESFNNKLVRWYSESDAIADSASLIETASFKNQNSSLISVTNHQGSNFPFSSFHTPARLPSLPTTPLQRIFGQTPLRAPKSVRRGAHLQSDVQSRILGTPDYLAPELLHRLGHGPAVDWWALGVCLFEFMTGVPPFNDQTPEAVFHNILQRDIPWPENKEALSTSAVEVIDNLLSFDPKARPDFTHLKSFSLFKGINWAFLRDSPAPFVPKPDGATDTTYFEARNNIQNLRVSNFDL